MATRHTWTIVFVVEALLLLTAGCAPTSPTSNAPVTEYRPTPERTPTGYWPATSPQGKSTPYVYVPAPSRPNYANDSEATDRVIYATNYDLQLESGRYPDFRVSAEGDRATDLVIQHPRMSVALANAAFNDADLQAVWKQHGFRRVVFRNPKGAALIRDLR